MTSKTAKNSEMCGEGANKRHRGMTVQLKQQHFIWLEYFKERTGKFGCYCISEEFSIRFFIHYCIFFFFQIG